MKTKLTAKQKGIIVLLIVLIVGGLLLWWFSRKQAGEISYQRLTGPNTGYQLQIELDETPINPTPGWQVKGRVVVLSENGDVVTGATGGVLLYLGQAPSSDADGNGYSMSPGYQPVLTTSGEYYNPKFLVGNQLLDYAEKDLVTTGIRGGKVGSWIKTEDGYELQEAPAETMDGARGMSPRYLVLENGQAEFAYLSRGNDIGVDRITMTASTIETQTGSGYQLVPPAGLRRDKNQIRTIATIPVNSKVANRWLQPATYHQSADDYYYDIRVRKYGFWIFTWVPQPVQLTITPRALPGKRLPANIDDTLTLKLQRAYPLNSIKFSSRFSDSNQKALGSRFVRYGSATGSAASGRSQDELVIKMDKKPVRVVLQSTNNPTQVGLEHILLAAKKNTATTDSYATQCQNARINISDSQSSGVDPEPFPLECLQSFSYSVVGWPVKGR